MTPISNVTSISNGNGHNGNGHNGHVTAAAAAEPEKDLVAVEFMKLAGRGAIDAVVETEKYAKTRGLGDFVFDSLSVQKIMVSLSIDLRKGARA